jgi:hypothetical protein
MARVCPKRLERLEGQLEIPLPTTTQWHFMAAAAKLLRPVLQELIRQAAQGRVLHNDDTSMRILRLAREPGDQRTGIFTSGIVSLVGAWRIALFFTGPKHAGENIAEVLKQRAGELPAPIQMCDALSRNPPKLPGVRVLLANCLLMPGGSWSKSQTTFLKNAGTCSKRSAVFITTTHWRGNRNYQRKKFFARDGCPQRSFTAPTGFAKCLRLRRIPFRYS